MLSSLEIQIYESKTDYSFSTKPLRLVFLSSTLDSRFSAKLHLSGSWASINFTEKKEHTQWLFRIYIVLRIKAKVNITVRAERHTVYLCTEVKNTAHLIAFCTTTAYHFCRHYNNQIEEIKTFFASLWSLPLATVIETALKENKMIGEG